jgi:hypothetical protein
MLRNLFKFVLLSISSSLATSSTLVAAMINSVLSVTYRVEIVGRMCALSL